MTTQRGDEQGGGDDLERATAAYQAARAKAMAELGDTADAFHAAQDAEEELRLKMAEDVRRAYAAGETLKSLASRTGYSISRIRQLVLEVELEEDEDDLDGP